MAAAMARGETIFRARETFPRDSGRWQRQCSGRSALRRDEPRAQPL